MVILGVVFIFVAGLSLAMSVQFLFYSEPSSSIGSSDGLGRLETRVAGLEKDLKKILDFTTPLPSVGVSSPRFAHLGTIPELKERVKRLESNQKNPSPVEGGDHGCDEICVELKMLKNRVNHIEARETAHRVIYDRDTVNGSDTQGDTNSRARIYYGPGTDGYDTGDPRAAQVENSTSNARDSLEGGRTDNSTALSSAEIQRLYYSDPNRKWPDEEWDEFSQHIQVTKKWTVMKFKTFRGMHLWIPTPRGTHADALAFVRPGVPFLPLQYFFDAESKPGVNSTVSIVTKPVSISIESDAIAHLAMGTGRFADKGAVRNVIMEKGMVKLGEA